MKTEQKHQRAVLCECAKTLRDDNLAYIGTTSYCVLVSLIRRANNTGVCFPSQETIAKEWGMGRRTIVRALKELVKMHAIVKVKPETVLRPAHKHAYNINVLAYQLTGIILTDTGYIFPYLWIIGDKDAKTETQKNIVDNIKVLAGADTAQLVSDTYRKLYSTEWETSKIRYHIAQITQSPIVKDSPNYRQYYESYSPVLCIHNNGEYHGEDQISPVLLNHNSGEEDTSPELCIHNNGEVANSPGLCQNGTDSNGGLCQNGTDPDIGLPSSLCQNGTQTSIYRNIDIRDSERSDSKSSGPENLESEKSESGSSFPLVNSRNTFVEAAGEAAPGSLPAAPAGDDAGRGVRRRRGPDFDAAIEVPDDAWHIFGSILAQEVFYKRYTKVLDEMCRRITKHGYPWQKMPRSMRLRLITTICWFEHYRRRYRIKDDLYTLVIDHYTKRFLLPVVTNNGRRPLLADDFVDSAHNFIPEYFLKNKQSFSSEGL